MAFCFLLYGSEKERKEIKNDYLATPFFVYFIFLINRARGVGYPRVKGKREEEGFLESVYTSFFFSYFTATLIFQ